MISQPALSPFQFLAQTERFFLKALAEDEALKSLSLDNKRVLNFRKEFAILELWMEVTPKVAEAPSVPEAPAEGEAVAEVAEQQEVKKPSKPESQLECIARLEVQGVPQKEAKSAYKVDYSLLLNEKKTFDFILVESEGGLIKESFKAAHYFKAYLYESLAGQLENTPESFPTKKELKEQINKDLEAAIAAGTIVIKEKAAPSNPEAAASAEKEESAQKEPEPVAQE